MKRTTKIHLAVGRENQLIYTCQSARRGLATILRNYRQTCGHAEARRIHRRLHGPLLPVE